MNNIIKHAFVCDFCREKCKGSCFEQLMAIKNNEVKPGDREYELNKDLIGRKHIIHCLGKYCDSPCELQKEDYTPYNEDDGLTPLIDALKYMVGRCNELLVNKEKIKDKD